MSPESQSRSRRRLVERGLTLDVVFHAEPLACDDHGLRVMQQPIQDGRGQGAVVVEDRRPLLEGPVRGDNDRPLCIAQTADVEEQISASRVNGERAQLVEDEQRGLRVWLAFLFETPSTPGGSKRVDYLNGAGKEHRGALEAGGIAQRRRQVGCAQAHAPEKAEVGCVADTLAAEVVLHLRVRLLRGGHGHLSPALRVRRDGTRHAAHSPDQCDGASHGPMEAPAAARSDPG